MQLRVAGLTEFHLSFGHWPSDVSDELGGDIPQSALDRFVTAGLGAVLHSEEASGDAGERRVGRKPQDDPSTAPGIADLEPGEDPCQETGEGELPPETGDVESRATAGDRDSRPLKLPSEFLSEHDVHQLGEAVQPSRLATGEGSEGKWTLICSATRWTSATSD